MNLRTADTPVQAMGGDQLDLINLAEFDGFGTLSRRERLFVEAILEDFLHRNAAKRAGGGRWAGQLYGAGATRVDWFDFAGLARPDGQPVKDLADFATTLNLEGPAAAHLFMEFQTSKV